MENGIVSSGIVVDFAVIGIALLPYWFGMMRLVRGQVLSVSQREYVQAAKIAGASNAEYYLGIISISNTTYNSFCSFWIRCCCITEVFFFSWPWVQRFHSLKAYIL